MHRCLMYFPTLKDYAPWNSWGSNRIGVFTVRSKMVGLVILSSFTYYYISFVFNTHRNPISNLNSVFLCEIIEYERHQYNLNGSRHL